MSNIEKSLRKSSGWSIHLVLDCNINILKYKPSSGSIYVKLPKKVDHTKDVLINIQNIDGKEFFK